jgi:hypothetical protein
MTISPTLPCLLWDVINRLELDYIAEGAGRDGMPSVDQWANLLRVLGSTGTDRHELPALLRLSKRAVRLRVSSAGRRGWAEELKFGCGSAAVRLTDRGSEVASGWYSLQCAAEARWRAAIGTERTETLRRALQKGVAALSLEHPHYPASYGAADASITGGNGRDWKAVPRGKGDTVSNLSLLALASQALVAFAMSYEEKSPVALSLSATVIKCIPPEGRPLQGLADTVGISALCRHGFLRVSRHDREMVHLTPRGSAVSDAYDERIEGVEREWGVRFGEISMAGLRSALEDAAKRL